MKNDASKLLIVTVGTLLLLMACNSTQPVVTEDIPQGNCVGKITDEKGTPIAGASVVLVPEGYVAMSSGGGLGVLDSTVSNAAGYYGFNVETSGKYNLLANDNYNYVLRRAIPVNAGAQLDLPDEKLIPPGSLNGSVYLESKEDHRSAVILLTGTNTFVSPSDISGGFSVAKLAQGSYDLRILSTESGFSEAETTITVVSGEQTILPPITLARKQVPVIDEFSVEFDPYLMKVSLSWRTSNNDIIDSINLYCNREQNIKPILTVAEGRVEALEQVRTRKKSIKRLIDLAAEELDGKSRPILAVAHANAPDDAQKLLEMASVHLNPVETMITELSPVIGTHVGPGTVALGYYYED